MTKTSLQFLWEKPGAPGHFQTGVSLHSHTSRSRESLGFLADFQKRFAMLPVVLWLAAWQHRRATGRRLDIGRAFWTPPLDPVEALQTETRQIHKLGLSALVSLTDHDAVDAGLSLQAVSNPAAVPVSMEWTVPYGSTFFHFGVHNLPPLEARRLRGDMEEYTAHPAGHRLAELLESLHALPRVLTVVNHPAWDIGGVGEFQLGQTLDSMLRTCGRWIHALELNGLRPWAENCSTLGLASRWSKPVVSGGDRHGAEPNATVNLTDASTFDDFVGEVRESVSHVLFLPQYRAPLRRRWLQTVADILRFYPDANGRRCWTDRFFYECEDGSVRTVAQTWGAHRPHLLNTALAMFRVLQWAPAVPAAMPGYSDPTELSC